MGSVDGARAFHIASDETFDNICEPCKTDGITIEAKHFCEDCGEYICDACKKYHIRLSITKNHTILSGNQCPASVSKTSEFKILCDCNANQEVQYYCDGHREVVCSPCKTFKHHRCKTSTIQQICSEYKSSTFASVLSKTISLRDRYDNLKQESIGNASELNRRKEACKKDIENFRKELDTFLKELERDLFEELDKYERKEQHQIEENISTLTTALKLLESNYKLLEDARINGRREIMFASDVQVSRSLEGFECMIADLEESIAKPVLSFERDRTLTDIKTLGSLISNRRTGLQSDQVSLNTGGRHGNVLLGRKIQLHKEIFIKSPNDENKPCISGITAMANGYVVLCDYTNKKLKILDNTWVHTRNFPLSGPWDVSVVDTNNVIVSLPLKKKLQQIQVFPRMKSGRTIKLDKKCWGIDLAGDEIYVSCHNNSDDGEVRVLDLNGNFRRRLGVTTSGTFMFILPYYITVNKANEKVYVSDGATHVITCMTADGRIIFRYSDDDMKSPRGLYCDSADNILVCGSDNLQVITADGKKYDTLLSSREGINSPYTISYKDGDDILIVGSGDDVVPDHRNFKCNSDGIPGHLTITYTDGVLLFKFVQQTV